MTSYTEEEFGGRMIQVTEIPNNNFRYMTVFECIAENAIRHLDNGNRHLSEGRPEWAAGSYRKAIRNFRKSLQLRGLF